MLHTQRAFDAIERMQIDGSKFHKKLDSERQYQKGRMARRLKQRALERKLGITQSNWSICFANVAAVLVLRLLPPLNSVAKR